MSAYRTHGTVMNCQAVLVKCLQKRFAQVKVHPSPQTLLDWHGKVRPDKAEIIIRRKFIDSVSNDMGFTKNDQGNFDAIISDYDAGRHDQKWLNDLAKDYMEERATELMTDQECEVAERAELPDGRIQIRYRVMA